MRVAIGNNIFSGNAGALQRPLARTIAFLGDSITDVTQTNSSAGNRSTRWDSYANWSVVSSNNRFYTQYNPTGSSSGWPAVGTYEFATFGAPISLIQSNHLTELNAAPADLVCVLAGANDLGNIGSSAATVMAAMTTLINALKTNGHTNLLVCALTPRAAANNSTGLDGKTFAVRCQEANALLASNASVLGYKFCDWTPVIADGSGFWNAGFSDDNIHPNAQGAQVMGEFLSSFILANYSTYEPVLNADFIASLNAGSIPTSGFAAFTYGGTGVGSVVAGDDGFGDWLRLTTNHTLPDGYTERTRTNAPIPPEWGLVDGDLIQPVFEVRMLSDNASIGMEFIVTGNSRTSRFGFPGTRMARKAFHGLLLGQPFPVLSTTTPTLQVKVSGTGVVDFRRIGFRKVNSMIPPFV